MQYLLTESEYEALNTVQQLRADAQKTALQALCTQAALHIPVPVESGEARPWGCVLVPATTDYCDDCPASTVCPNEFKSWSP